MTEPALVLQEKKFEFVQPVGGKSYCQLDVFVPADWKDRGQCALVLMTDSCIDGSKVTVTSASEFVATKVFKEILEPKFPEMNPAFVLWVERYPRGVGREYEDLSSVQYAQTRLMTSTLLTQPRWRVVRTADILKAFPGAGVMR